MTKQEILVWHMNNYKVLFNENAVRESLMLEQVKDERSFCVLQTNEVDRTRVANSLDAQLMLISYEQCKDFEYSQLLKYVFENIVSGHKFKKVIVFNAYVLNNGIDEERAITNAFNNYKMQSAKLSKALEYLEILQRPIAFDLFVARILIEHFNIKFDLEVNDPLQLKLSMFQSNLVKYWHAHDFSLNSNADNIFIDSGEFAKTTLRFDFLPASQYAYAKEHSFDVLEAVKESFDKELDFAFALHRGYTQTSMKLRDPIITAIQKADVKSSWFQFRNSSKFEPRPGGVPAFIPYEDYLDKLRSAKCTLVIQSHDVRFFSLRRFFEAICCGCVPLVDKASNYQAGFSYDKEFIDFAEQHLVVDATNHIELRNKIAETADNCNILFNKMAQLKFFKERYFNEQWYYNYTKQLTQ